MQRCLYAAFKPHIALPLHVWKQYGRKGEGIHRMKPFDVEVRSTLGAGDTFKAGCVYGLLHGMADADLVRFASACSAVAISRFPLPLHPPKPEEVRALIVAQKG